MDLDVDEEVNHLRRHATLAEEQIGHYKQDPVLYYKCQLLLWTFLHCGHGLLNVDINCCWAATAVVYGCDFGCGYALCLG